MYTVTAKPFEPSPTHIGRIAYGEDIITSLETYSQQHQIQTAWINLLGAVSEVTLAYYRQDTHEYVTQAFHGEFEILNGTGNISLKDGAPFAHIHLTLSNTQFNCFGGHLIKGSSKVFACEFALFTGTGTEPLVRQPDSQTGLGLWPMNCSYIREL